MALTYQIYYNFLLEILILHSTHADHMFNVLVLCPFLSPLCFPLFLSLSHFVAFFPLSFFLLLTFIKKKIKESVTIDFSSNNTIISLIFKVVNSCNIEIDMWK